jgi:hypothetical protein
VSAVSFNLKKNKSREVIGGVEAINDVLPFFTLAAEVRILYLSESVKVDNSCRGYREGEVTFSHMNAKLQKH